MIALSIFPKIGGRCRASPLLLLLPLPPPGRCKASLLLLLLPPAALSVSPEEAGDRGDDGVAERAGGCVVACPMAARAHSRVLSDLVHKLPMNQRPGGITNDNVTCTVNRSVFSSILHVTCRVNGRVFRGIMNIICRVDSREISGMINVICRVDSRVLNGIMNVICRLDSREIRALVGPLLEAQKPGSHATCESALCYIRSLIFACEYSVGQFIRNM